MRRTHGLLVSAFDYYEELRNQLMDMIQHFHTRLKVNSKNNQVVFASDIHSVFDICWYTLARIIIDFGPPEEGGRTRELSEDALITYLHCAEASSSVITAASFTAKRSNAKVHTTLQGNGNIAPIKS